MCEFAARGVADAGFKFLLHESIGCGGGMPRLLCSLLPTAEHGDFLIIILVALACSVPSELMKFLFRERNPRLDGRSPEEVKATMKPRHPLPSWSESRSRAAHLHVLCSSDQEILFHRVAGPRHAASPCGLLCTCLKKERSFSGAAIFY